MYYKRESQRDQDLRYLKKDLQGRRFWDNPSAGLRQMMLQVFDTKLNNVLFLPGSHLIVLEARQGTTLLQVIISSRSHPRFEI